jgi:broad specificity phosphatase PhoE
MPSSIYLARHATPDRFRPGFIYHQLPGPPLALQGIQEAQLLGIYFISGGVRRIYTSPFERCRHTAEIAGGENGIPWQVEEVLGELLPGETPEAILARVRPPFERFCSESLLDGPVAMITHGGVVGVLLAHLGMGEAELARRKVFDFGNPVPPAGVWLAEKDDAQTEWELRLTFQPEPTPQEM